MTWKTNKPYKIFADMKTLEQGALDQFTEAMDIPWVITGALMPDAHVGYTLPIGGVIATKDMIVPSYCGVDIGCGMCAAKFDGLKREDIEDRKDEIFDGIYRAIPVGFNHHKKDEKWLTPAMKNYKIYSNTDIMARAIELRNPLKQIGTLGGGNHFIEIGYDEDDDVWAILHSGSRGFGYYIANEYVKLAHPEGKVKDGHYGFHIDSKNGEDYYCDMNIALDFALANRMHMLAAISGVIGCGYIEDSFINRNHNHAELAHNMIIHRKGATHAEEGMMGVIPGNMRDGSFIVKGKGNPDALWSSSHGAGRVLGRKAAKKALDMETFKNDMVGIKAKVVKDTLDESAGAYKDIFEVMELQKDLVEIIHHVKPLINIKA